MDIRTRLPSFTVRRLMAWVGVAALVMAATVHPGGSRPGIYLDALGLAAGACLDRGLTPTGPGGSRGPSALMAGAWPRRGGGLRAGLLLMDGRLSLVAGDHRVILW